MSQNEKIERKAAPPAAPKREVPRLLEMYGRALDDAAALPPLFTWVPCRPSRWRFLRPFSKLPRLTLGTHTLLVRHIDRNLAAVIRHYSVKEALDHRTDEEAKDHSSCMAFRNSLPSGKLAFTIIGITIPATMAALLLSSLSEHFFSKSIRRSGLINDTFQKLAKESLDLITGGGGGDLLGEVAAAMRLGTGGVLTLLAITFITGYLATRPLVSGFRLKRQILGLADQDVLGVKDTASSWYVNKSVGAYTQEHRVAEALGLRRRPNEHPLDLATLAFPAMCVSLLAVLFAYVQGREFVEHFVTKNLKSGGLPLPITLYIPFSLFIWLASLGLLRFKWLDATWRGRQSTQLAPPLAYVTSNGDYVESRPVIESAAWPLATLCPSPAYVPQLYPLVGAAQFYRLALTGDRLRAEVARRNGRARRKGHPVLATAVFATSTLMYIAKLTAFPVLPFIAVLTAISTPMVISVHLWRLCALLDQPRTARKYRVLTVLASLPLVASGPMLIIGPAEESWRVVSYFVLSLGTVLYPLLIATIQRCQNYLVQRLATPVPYGQCEDSQTRLVPEQRPAHSR